MPLVAFACRLAAWFVLGASLAGVVYFLRFDGLGLVVAGFLVVQGAALGVGLWAVGRIAAETARIARRVAPARAPRAETTATPTPTTPATREMTPDELDDFFGRPRSLAAHRASQRRG